MSVAAAALCGLCGCSSEPAPDATPAPAPAPAPRSLEEAGPLPLAAFDPATAMPSFQSTSVVATVNGADITGADLQQEMQGLMAQLRERGMPPEQVAQAMPRILEQTVANLVSRRALLQVVAAKGVAVTEEEVGEVVGDMLENAPPEETLATALDRIGVTEAQFRTQLAENLQIQKLIVEETRAAVNVTDAELQAFYDEHPEQFDQGEAASARHILVKVDAGADAAVRDAARAKAEGVRERLLNGEDFAVVCKETSDDPGSRDKGGLYEDFPRGQMVPPFDAAVFSQEIGTIGPLVETDFGYHVIRVEKRRSASKVELDEVRDRLKAHLENQKMNGAAQSYIDGVLDAADISYGAGFTPPPPAPPMPIGLPR